MSEVTILAFLNSVVHDPDLKARVERATSVDELLSIAGEVGCSFEAEDLIRLVQGHEAYGARMGLSDAELETVGGRRAGGTIRRDDLTGSGETARCNPCTNGAPITCFE